jgi:hypothetical protein
MRTMSRAPWQQPATRYRLCDKFNGAKQSMACLPPANFKSWFKSIDFEKISANVRI